MKEALDPRDANFAAACFAFAALVGFPLAVVSFVAGLLISFG